MKILKRIFSGIIWTLAGLYVLVIVLFHIPAIQGFIAAQAEIALEEKFNTEFEIGRVDLGFLNRLIIDDITMHDQSGEIMLKTSRLSIKVDYIPLLSGKVSISSAQIFGADGRFYKKDNQSTANYQFAIDALASKDTISHTKLDISVGSLIIRNGRFKYDRHDVVQTRGKFNVNHISLKDISAHIVMPYLTDDSLKVQLKKLSMKEESGLDLQNLSLKFTADKNKATLSDFNIKLPSTNFNIDNVEANYVFENDKLETESIRLNGKITNTTVTLCDLACFENTLKYVTTPLRLSADIWVKGEKINVSNFSAYSKNNNINISADMNAAKTDNGTRWALAIKDFFVNENIIAELSSNMKDDGKEFPEIITRLGNIDLNVAASGKNKEIKLKSTIKTSVGNTTLDAEMHNNAFTANIQTDALYLDKLLSDEKFGIAIGEITTKGTLNGKKINTLEMNGILSQFTYNNYTFNNIEANGTLNGNTINGILELDDPNGKLQADINMCIDKNNPSIQLYAQIDNADINAMKLVNRCENTTFSADIQADLKGATRIPDGYLTIENFSMKSPEKSYTLDKLQIAATNESGIRTVTLNSDFADGIISGTYNYSTILQSITNIIGNKLPTLPGLPAINNKCENDFTLDLKIFKSDWAKALLDLPLEINSPIYITGKLDDNNRSLNLIANFPQFSYGESNYDNGTLILNTDDTAPTTTEDTLKLSMSIDKLMENGRRMRMTAKAGAANNRLTTSISWNGKNKISTQGVINSTTDFFMTAQGKPAAHMLIHPSEILINDTVWNISKSEIVYSKKRLEVDDFTIKHNNQHLILSGTATDNATDSLTVDLQDIDVSYILSLVNFTAVDFDGYASGKACIKSAFGTPDAYANLKIRRFRFQDGRMGTLTAKARWNREEKQIDINASANDGPGIATLINGYISPARNYIDLDIEARNTNIEFLESFCGSFMKNINAHANGKVRLAGDLSFINLTGQLVADGTIDISTLNTTYNLSNDTITLIPDEIIFSNDTVRDIYGNIGIVNGQLHHKHLTRLTYDLDISARNLLSYDFPDYNGSTFYGKVYATGNCTIKGRSGRIDFDITGRPETGSFIEYDAASPSTISKQDFIKWGETLPDTASISSTRHLPDEDSNASDISSDLHINFSIDATPDFTLRVLMDKRSGDCIALNGNGALKAEYYNKGAFNMYGNYNIEHGTYKLTIRNIMNRVFQFSEGGSIVFGGDPYNASLDLNAVYTLNSVPLSDLQIGRSFSTNNVRVDCMMKISGTPLSPHVDFDLDIPTVNNDAKQMVKSLINSEEEMNQQVIYLLSIGRFYIADNNAAADGEQMSQTTLAMQSLLSGTISQQINNMLSSVVKSDNWNFGANISTGDEGWNNAEYEGLMNGKLLNNRLLINGQFGYRNNKNATTSFIGDFDIRYLLYPNGNLAVKVYNQTTDRYFTKSSLNTQGLGLIIKKDFNSWIEMFGIRKKKKEKRKD